MWSHHRIGARRPGRQGITTRLGTGVPGTQPARHRKRRAGASAPARSLASEARTRAARSQQGQVEEEYHRFMAKLPTTLSATDRERIQALAQNVPSLWNAADTTTADRKRIVRCLVERVVVVIDKTSERNDVTIVWKGGLTTQHQLARPVSRFEHLKDYQRLIDRLKELHRQGLHRGQVAAQLNAEG